MARTKDLRIIIIPGLGIFPAGNQKKGVFKINKKFKKIILDSIDKDSKISFQSKFKLGACILSC